MGILAVSDLHIHGADDPVYRSLLALIQDKAKPGDILVLVGDLFDLFVGNKKIYLERYAEFFKAIREACGHGVKVHYLEGNHDFLIHKAFAGIQGLEIHSSELRVDLGGKRFYFAHGDLADRKDYGYLALRSFFRSPIMKALVLMTPGEWLDRIGTASSRKSRATKPLLPQELPQGKMESLRKTYRSYAAERLAQGYDYVVMGHCHDLDEMFFKIGGRSGQYVNVGFPRVHGSYLSWNPGEEKIQREKLP